MLIAVVGTSLAIFGNARTSSGNRQISSEVAVTFSEIPVMNIENIRTLTAIGL